MKTKSDMWKEAMSLFSSIGDLDLNDVNDDVGLLVNIREAVGKAMVEKDTMGEGEPLKVDSGYEFHSHPLSTRDAKKKYVHDVEMKWSDLYVDPPRVIAYLEGEKKYVYGEQVGMTSDEGAAGTVSLDMGGSVNNVPVLVVVPQKNITTPQQLCDVANALKKEVEKLKKVFEVCEVCAGEGAENSSPDKQCSNCDGAGSLLRRDLSEAKADLRKELSSLAPPESATVSVVEMSPEGRSVTAKFEKNMAMDNQCYVSEMEFFGAVSLRIEVAEGKWVLSLEVAENIHQIPSATGGLEV